LELRRRYRSEKKGSEGVARVIRTGEAELAEDVSGYVAVNLTDEEADLYARLAPRSYMIVPLVARGRTIGALTLLSTIEGRHYTRADLDFAQHLSRRFALAVDNARLYDEAERARNLVDTLFDSAPVGLGFYDTELLCVRVNEALAEMNGLPLDEQVGRDLEELFGDAGERLVTICRRVLETGQPVVGLDFSAEMPSVPGTRRHFTVSLTPLRAPDGAVLGVAAAVMDVTERRTLLERERATARRASFLARAGEILESSLDFDATLQNVANVCVPDVADICWVRVVGEGGEIRLGAFAHEDRAHDAVAIELDSRFPVDPDSGVGAMAAIRTGRTDVVPLIDPDVVRAAIGNNEQADLFASLGATASISVPLRARNRTVGAITVMTAQSQRSFTSDDVRLMEELARRAGLSIDNARLYTERTRIAHTLQAELLPSRLPVVPGAEVAVRYRAAGELNEVGGDFYDVFQRPDGDTALVIGDVSGKGAEAAAVTALARHTVRASSMHGSSPCQALTMLNDALVVQRGGAEFCTVCAARLGADGALDIALAGHPPALVLRRDGSVERHGEAGTLLGVFPDPSLTQTSLSLDAGDTLLLYTDGVTDTGPGGAELGEAALEQLLATLAGRSPEEIVAEVERVAVATQDDQPRDDIALLAVRIGAERPELDSNQRPTP
ncbi:MAG: hypothetical protein QOE08_934, partial [Thermoleophilaceae bacterium]|nr:hypothetical protein [Thermoleophilaceae bacterium]